MNNDDALSKYLKSKIKEKNISMYEVFKRLGGDHTLSGGDLSYKQIQYLIKGKHKKPKHETLKLLARALNEPYTDLLMVAGYINQNDLEEINTMLRDLLAPMFDEEVVDVLCDEVMLEILESILETTGNDRKELMASLRTYARGFVAERINKNECPDEL